jgi:hypothetical protein
MMQLISNTSFEGERPLFNTDNLRLENVKFLPGESAVKECNNVEACRCEFIGKYPFWHNSNTVIDDCLFTVGARAAIWYTRDLRMSNTLVEAPKMFREVRGLRLENVQLPNAAECCWNCRNLVLRKVEARGGDYMFMNSKNINIEDFRLQGNYAFQNTSNVIIRNAVLDTKDAFWETENVVVYDSSISGEYIGWHSRNLRLVNCRLSGTQPLCYAENLTLENCTMDADCDLCFEYSTLNAVINSRVTSIKNPNTGTIAVAELGELIIDRNCINPGACRITVGGVIVAP